MSTKGYTFLGWVVWRITKPLAKLYVAQNRAKLGAVGVIALVLFGGIIAAKQSSDA